MDTSSFSEQALNLLASTEHALLVLATIFLVLIFRWGLPQAFEGRLANIAVFYPAPISISGALLGLSSLEGTLPRVAIGVIIWGLAALVYKIGKPILGPLLVKLAKRTTGIDVPPDVLD